MDRYVSNPFTILLIAIFIAVLILLIPLFFFGLIGSALAKLGFTLGEALLIFILILAGSFINIPVTTIESPQTVLRREYSFFGMFYRIREISPTTVLAINVGGAVIPTMISLYLFFVGFGMMGATFLISALVGVAVVTFITNRVAQPVEGLGIATPFFVPPLAALFVGLVFAWGDPMAAPLIAYISGTLGTLIGADLLNLKEIGKLGAPVASIGGAGTFDGIFLSGIIAAFLA